MYVCKNQQKFSTYNFLSLTLCMYICTYYVNIKLCTANYDLASADNLVKYLCVVGIFFICSNELEPCEEQLPDIMWCRDPFMEQLNEIEATDGTRN